MQIVKIHTTIAGRSEQQSVRPRRIGLLAILFAVVALLAFSAGVQPALADDELRLIGIVKTIDTRTGIVFVDVQTESCPGIRRFRADDLGVVQRYLNQEMTFYIDSSTCRDTGIHTILTSRGKKK